MCTQVGFALEWMEGIVLVNVIDDFIIRHLYPRKIPTSTLLFSTPSSTCFMTAGPWVRTLIYEFKKDPYLIRNALRWAPKHQST
jgi:hypothetical protein